MVVVHRLADFSQYVILLGFFELIVSDGVTDT